MKINSIGNQINFKALSKSTAKRMLEDARKTGCKEEVSLTKLHIAEYDDKNHFNIKNEGNYFRIYGPGYSASMVPSPKFFATDLADAIKLSQLHNQLFRDYLLYTWDEENNPQKDEEFLGILTEPDPE